MRKTDIKKGKMASKGSIHFPTLKGNFASSNGSDAYDIRAGLTTAQASMDNTTMPIRSPNARNSPIMTAFSYDKREEGYGSKLDDSMDFSKALELNRSVIVTQQTTALGFGANLSTTENGPEDIGHEESPDKLFATARDLNPSSLGMASLRNSQIIGSFDLPKLNRSTLWGYDFKTIAQES